MVTRNFKNKRRKFKRQDYHRYVRISGGWRRPRGRQSKMRAYKRGNGPHPRIGYGNNKSIRGFINGKKVIPVNNMNDLLNIENKTGIAIMISGKLGLKKYDVISKKANELGIAIINTKRIKKVSKLAKFKSMKKEAVKKKETEKKETKHKEEKTTKEHKEEMKKETAKE